MTTTTVPKKSGISRRGFASMTPEQRKRIASMGGKTAHLLGVAHQYTSEEARAAGKISAKVRGAKAAGKQ